MKAPQVDSLQNARCQGAQQPFRFLANTGFICIEFDVLNRTTIGRARSGDVSPYFSSLEA